MVAKCGDTAQAQRPLISERIGSFFAGELTQQAVEAVAEDSGPSRPTMAS